MSTGPANEGEAIRPSVAAHLPIAFVRGSWAESSYPGHDDLRGEGVPAVDAADALALPFDRLAPLSTLTIGERA